MHVWMMGSHLAMAFCSSVVKVGVCGSDVKSSPSSEEGCVVRYSNKTLMCFPIRERLVGCKAGAGSSSSSSSSEEVSSSQILFVVGGCSLVLCWCAAALFWRSCWACSLCKVRVLLKWCSLISIPCWCWMVAISRLCS